MCPSGTSSRNSFHWIRYPVLFERRCIPVIIWRQTLINNPYWYLWLHYGLQFLACTCTVTWKPATGWGVHWLTAWVRISPRADGQKLPTDGFYLETLNPQVHGRGEFTMLSTFYQGQESSLGAWLNKGLASKEVWPWVGRKNSSWKVGLYPALSKAL